MCKGRRGGGGKGKFQREENGKLSVKFLELRVEIDRRVRKCATGVASNAASTAELNTTYSHATSHDGKPAACGRVRSRASPPASAIWQSWP